MTKTWIITGVGGGLGRAMAVAALARGDQVFGLLREPGAADAFAAIAPGRAIPLIADMTDRAAVMAAVTSAVDQSGGIDILVNNAGQVLMSYVEEVEPDAVRRLFEVNLIGPLSAIQAVLPSMRARGRGHIINVSSGGGIEGVPTVGLYSASKFALEGLSEALAQEVGGLGIAVTIIEPGAFRTELLAKRTSIPTAIPDYERTVGRMLARLQGMGGQEPGDPAKLAAAVLAIADAPDPPLRLPLNDDAIAMAERKAAAILAPIARWRDVATGLSFDAGEN